MVKRKLKLCAVAECAFIARFAFQNINNGFGAEKIIVEFKLNVGFSVGAAVIAD